MESIILRIAQLLSFGLPLPEIHLRLVTGGVSETTFYLAFHAAKVLIGKV